MSTEFVGAEFLENHLTGFGEKQAKKRGRPPDIKDDALRHAQAELAFVLEQKWALVGWPLQQANTLSDVRAALKLITGMSCQHLEAFCREPVRETTAASLRETRKRLIQARNKSQTAYEPFARDESAQQALRAITNPSGSSLSLSVEGLSVWAEAIRIWEKAKTSCDALQAALEQQEAYFAQSELLDFIQSRRYAFTPLSFASAMAGLPYISWRQSCNRCAGFQDHVSSITYRMFLIVERACTLPITGTEEAVERLKTSLMRPQHTDREACRMLRENWHFLRLAIPSGHRTKQTPKRELPYRIFAEYQRRVENQSKLDTALARKERL